MTLRHAGKTMGLFSRHKPLLIHKSENPPLVLRDITYNGDGILTVHNADFRNCRRFQESFEAAIAFDPDNPDLRGLEWRCHTVLWAANQALQREGCFVECGVNYGVLAKMILDYFWKDFRKRTFWLYDTWEDPKAWQAAQERFRYPAELIRGEVPHSLIPVEKVAYLSLDMNGVDAERGAIEFFYPRMVSGGVIYLDDYGWFRYKEQKKMFDTFFADKPETILQLPTGQGLIVKI